MSQIEPIHAEALAFARRRMARKIAAAIVGAMAECDFNFTQIAARLGKTEKDISAWMSRLFDGDGSGAQMDHLSDILLAMGCELDFQIVAAKPIPFREPATNSADAA